MKVIVNNIILKCQHEMLSHVQAIETEASGNTTPTKLLQNILC